MRRFGATLALAFFLIVPVLQWHCVMACAEDDAPTQAAACPHRTATLATPALQDEHDCDHPVAPALVASSIKPSLQLQLMATADHVVIADTSVTFARPALEATRPPGCSPGTSAVPLRV